MYRCSACLQPRQGYRHTAWLSPLDIATPVRLQVQSVAALYTRRKAASSWACSFLVSLLDVHLKHTWL